MILMQYFFLRKMNSWSKRLLVVISATFGLLAVNVILLAVTELTCSLPMSTAGSGPDQVLRSDPPRSVTLEIGPTLAGTARPNPTTGKLPKLVFYLLYLLSCFSCRVILAQRIQRQDILSFAFYINLRHWVLWRT